MIKPKFCLFLLVHLMNELKGMESTIAFEIQSIDQDMKSLDDLHFNQKDSNAFNVDDIEGNDDKHENYHDHYFSLPIKNSIKSSRKRNNVKDSLNEEIPQTWKNHDEKNIKVIDESDEDESMEDLTFSTLSFSFPSKDNHHRDEMRIKKMEKNDFENEEIESSFYKSKDENENENENEEYEEDYFPLAKSNIKNDYKSDNEKDIL